MQVFMEVIELWAVSLVGEVSLLNNVNWLRQVLCTCNEFVFLGDGEFIKRQDFNINFKKMTDFRVVGEVLDGELVVRVLLDIRCESKAVQVLLELAPDSLQCLFVLLVFTPELDDNSCVFFNKLDVDSEEGVLLNEQ